MILDHKAAVLTRLKSDPLLASCGFEGVVTTRPETYWTLFTDSGVRYSDRMSGLPTSGRLNYWIHWVGATPEQAQRLADHGVPLLAGWQPTVAGYAPARMRHLDSQPVELDAAVRPPLHFAVDHFQLITQPA